MKNFITTFLVVFLTQTSLGARPAPEYLRGGIITVTLKDGTTYNFSTDEYAVVKRGAKSSIIENNTSEATKPKLVDTKNSSAQTPHKNILSLGIIRSNLGLDTEKHSSFVEVTSKKEVGGQLQYQRRVSDKIYLGGQVDTNQGVGLSLGLGFD